MTGEIKALKQELRRELLKKRRALDAELAKQWSELVQEHILDCAEFAEAGVIASYAAFDKEVSLDRVFEEARLQGKSAAFPRIGRAEGEMHFYLADDPTEMLPNRFGIMEPPENAEKAGLTDIDLILVPGVAYDRGGWRLGIGGGYYDRAISDMRSDAKSIGVGYSIQLVQSVPHEAFDQRVKLIVTEEGLFNTSGMDPA